MTAELPSIGTIYLKFGDLGDAEAAYCAAKAHRQFWDIRYISPEHFGLKFRLGSPERSSFSLYEGQILVVAKYDNVHEPLDVGVVAGHVKQFLGNFGGLVSFGLIKNDDIASTYRAEYYNASVVHDALQVNGFKICVSSDPPSGTCSELTHTGVHLDHILLRARGDEFDRECFWPSHNRSRVWFGQCTG